MKQAERIKEHSIYDIIQRFYPAQYKHKGKGDYWAISPFRRERTPSFHVRDSKGYFCCFSTHEKGSAIDFVMKHERVDFWGAVKLIYEALGWDLESSEQADPRPAARKWFAKHCHDILKSSHSIKHLAYLTLERGLSMETLEESLVGYISYQDPIERVHDMAAAGIVKHTGTGRAYWNFGDRIIFPYQNVSGGIVGFSARATTDTQKAKYKNSSEEDGFSKSKSLYGIHEARHASQKEGRIIVVEGQMDRLSLREAGILACAAPGGTALTAEQAAIISSLGVQVLLFYDPDPAGVGAMFKATKILLSAGVIPAYVRKRGESKDMDPNKLLVSGTDIKKYIAENTHEIPEFFATSINMTPPSRKKEVADIFNDIVSCCLDSDMARMLGEDFASKCGIDPARVMAKIKVNNPPPVTVPSVYKRNDDAFRIICHAYQQPEDIDLIDAILGDDFRFQDPGDTLIWSYLKTGEEPPATIINSNAGDLWVYLTSSESLPTIAKLVLPTLCEITKKQGRTRQRKEIVAQMDNQEISAAEARELMMSRGLI